MLHSDSAGMRTQRIRVRSAYGDYQVICGAGLLARAGEEIRALGGFANVFVVSSPRVWRAVGRRVLRGLPLADHKRVILFDDREAAKQLKTVESLCRSLSRAGADRKSLLVAVGGGVVGDVAGFAAASYLRGVALAHVPTTLVAQVDSAIGGKTGVNLPGGKNLVGAFYAPRLVLVDPTTLRTLPQREFRGGLAEIIKYGAIADKALFSFLEKNLERLLKRDAALLTQVTRRCAVIKARVVSKDERESGLREILNFGHTFGHALESVTRYRRYQHGEAVAWGMMAAALLGHEIQITPAVDASRIISLIRRMGKLPAWPNVAPKKLIELMGSDKKTRNGKLRFVLTPGIGKAATYDAREREKLELIMRVTPKVAEADALVWRD